MAIALGQSELLSFLSVKSEVSRCQMEGDDKNGKEEYWKSLGRRDLAVDVMTIVGKILWGGPTFLFSKGLWRTKVLEIPVW